MDSDAERPRGVYKPSATGTPLLATSAHKSSSHCFRTSRTTTLWRQQRQRQGAGVKSVVLPVSAPCRASDSVCALRYADERQRYCGNNWAAVGARSHTYSHEPAHPTPSACTQREKQSTGSAQQQHSLHRRLPRTHTTVSRLHRGVRKAESTACKRAVGYPARTTERER